MTQLSEGYRLTEDRAEIDSAAAHAFLTGSYWAKGISLETVTAAIAGSLCGAALHQERQVGMVRVISDFATTAYLTDVYVLDEHRGHGLASAMLAHLQAHPRLQGLRRWMLFTLDAQPLYLQAGWNVYPYPERVMVRDNPGIYQ
ncbi:MAG: N-acetyltransferase [Novosphingobium sp.]|nr:N-acetyltransferase [Novosphingobium sp.]